MRKRRMVHAPTLFDGSEAVEPGRFARLDDFDGVPSYLLDIPESIPQLGYGSNQFFRYYGKFPSILGREIVKRFRTTRDSCSRLLCRGRNNPRRGADRVLSLVWD